MNPKHQNQVNRESSRPADKKDRSIHFIFIIIAIAGLLGVGLVLFSNHERNGSIQIASGNSGALPGIQAGDAPWPPELMRLRERLVMIGLPALQEEGSALHIHQHLDLFIHGKPVDVPSGIGFNPMERFISPVHTHNRDGIIHIESPTIQKFTLGQFFDIWGVRFDTKCIGSYCEDQKNFIKVFINGTAREGDRRSIELADHQVIVITYGENGDLPNPIPSRYSFPQGT